MAGGCVSRWLEGTGKSMWAPNCDCSSSRFQLVASLRTHSQRCVGFPCRMNYAFCAVMFCDHIFWFLLCFCLCLILMNDRCFCSCFCLCFVSLFCIVFVPGGTDVKCMNFGTERTSNSIQSLRTHLFSSDDDSCWMHVHFQPLYVRKSSLG